MNHSFRRTSIFNDFVSPKRINILNLKLWLISFNRNMHALRSTYLWMHKWVTFVTWLYFQHGCTGFDRRFMKNYVSMTEVPRPEYSKRFFLSWRPKQENTHPIRVKGKILQRRSSCVLNQRNIVSKKGGLKGFPSP